MTSADLPDYDVRINGSPLPRDARRDIRSITVQEDVDALSMFTIDLYNWDETRQQVSWSDAPSFAVGNEVTISLGSTNDLHQVMLAEITSLEPSFGRGRSPTLTVRGYDHRYRLARRRDPRSFSQMTASAIAAQLAREVGLGAEVENSRVVLDTVLKPDQSYLELLRGLAKRIGYEVYVRDKVLHFRPPQTAGRAALTLALDDDVTEFTPRMSAMPQVGEVVVRGWDVKEKKEIVGRAGVGQERSAMGGQATGPRATDRALGKATVATVGQPVETKAEADQLAQGRFDDMALDYIQGDLTCEGRPQVRAGTVVDIQGAGTRFSGLYYVGSVVHSLTPDGYETSLTVQRNAT